MDIETLYNTIFPLGGIDSNNNYINLTGSQINSVQLVEPTLSVEKFTLFPKDCNTDNLSADKYILPFKFANRIPLIAIDGYNIKQPDICTFKLDYTGFVPYVSFEFVDSLNSILSTNVPKEGSIIKIYIGGSGDELYYKPIRQDFILTSIRKVQGVDQNYGGYMRYRVYGKLNVPYGYRKETWAGGECPVSQALFNLAIWTGLGFSTNFTKPKTVDIMNWMNMATGTYFEFMEQIAGHACYSPSTFFTAFIDQYNVLNFVECHSLLSHGGKKTDVPQMIYKSFPPNSIPSYDKAIDGPKTTRNQLELSEYKTTKGDTSTEGSTEGSVKTDEFENEISNTKQKLSYYFLSNNDIFDGWTNFIEEYTEISNGEASVSDGSKTHATYSDCNLGDWSYGVCDFCIRPIDNLVRDAKTQKIKSIDDEPSKDSYIPLNLPHITKPEYLNKQTTVDDITGVESFVTFGNVDTTNMFKLYFFAEVQNKFQMKCLKRCGLQVKLQNYNPAITKFSRIWVDIYDKNMTSNAEISKKKSELGDEKVIDKMIEESPEKVDNYNRYLNERNKNILKFDGEDVHEEGFLDSITTNTNMRDENWPRGKYNRSLSGWYVITEIIIEYDPDDNNLKMNLKLNRIEYRPMFRDEYDRAKKAIDKYKEENLIEDLLDEGEIYTGSTSTSTESSDSSSS